MGPMLARSLVISVALGCGSGSSGTPAVTTGSGAPASSKGDPVDVKASVVGASAALLVELGGTYRCDQRVYPAPPAPHLTAWEWAFAAAPDALAEQLATRLVGAQREGRTFRFLDAKGQPEVVVDVLAPERSMLGCGDMPAGTGSLVIASRR